MIDALFHALTTLDGFFWGYVAFVLIMVLGSYLTIKNLFFQVRQVPSIGKTFFQLLRHSTPGERGVHPLRAFFASVGGMIGIGNVVGVVTAVQIGGPGALLWVWVTGMIGAIVKYSEIYLGLKYRVENSKGGFDGGPMYFLRAAFKNRFLPILVAFLLCIYGVEIYQFSVITESISVNWNINRFLVTGVLLVLVLYTGLGGVRRLGKICGYIMPFFMLTYLIMGLWILGHEATLVPSLLGEVFSSAFKGHAAVGGFAGSTVMMAIQHGMARSAYSADIGIGYDSIIQSESSTPYPERQARLAILGVLFDNLICTMSILLVLVTGIWKGDTLMSGSLLVQEALSRYFPYMNFFMPLFIAILGFTTTIAYFCVGIKCARYLLPRYGKIVYILYGTLCLSCSAFFCQSQALVIMSLAGSLLLIVNLLGIFALRHEISFRSPPELLSVQKALS